MPNWADLIGQYLEGPNLLRAATAGMTRDQVLARPVAGKWSTLEVVCHLADFEPVYADRMKRVIALERPLIMGADQDSYAAHLAYQQRDLEDELTIIEATRRQMGRILRSLPAEAFGQAGIHSERGVVSLEDLLTTACHHIPYHVPFIRQKREALGLPA